MSEQADAINGYKCGKCGHITVTINDVEGTTPFMIRCRRNLVGCADDAMAYSMFYNAPASSGVPQWEWYRPELADLTDEATKDHVRRGGLLLRKLDTQRRELRYKIKSRFA